VIQRFDTDKDMAALVAQRHNPKVSEIFARQSRYGDALAEEFGLQPIESVPDVLIPKDSYKEVIDTCHALKVFPIYHQYNSWCPPGQKWNQNGLGYCWTWSGTAALMTVRAAENKELVQLAPVSMGYLVNWRNAGNYLESFIKGAREQGIAPASHVPDSLKNNPSSFKPGWDTERAKYKLDGVWDTNTQDSDSTTIQHCLSVLAYGKPLYVAYAWWGHAVPVVSMRYDANVANKIVFVIRNSHNESDVIELVGSKAVPDEAFGFISTKTEE
jgi:hypothetical protein